MNKTQAKKLSDAEQGLKHRRAEVIHGMYEVLKDWMEEFADCPCDDPESDGHDNKTCWAYLDFKRVTDAYDELFEK